MTTLTVMKERIASFFERSLPLLLAALRRPVMSAGAGGDLCASFRAESAADVVLRGVGALANKRKVLGPVVGFVAVLVMNDLATLKPPPEKALHDDTVLLHVAVGHGRRVLGHPEQDVSFIGQATSAFPGRVLGSKSLPSDFASVGGCHLTSLRPRHKATPLLCNMNMELGGSEVKSSGAAS